MIYTVTEYFEDIADNRHAYHKGDTFPREGVTVSEARFAELSSDRNKRKRPVIAAVAGADDELQENAEQKTAEKPKAKRSRKKV